jgi:hypothetical protein
MFFRDSVDHEEVVHAADLTVLPAKLEDGLRPRWPDARQGHQVMQGCGVQVDGMRRRSFFRGERESRH